MPERVRKVRRTTMQVMSDILDLIKECEKKRPGSTRILVYSEGLEVPTEHVFTEYFTGPYDIARIYKGASRVNQRRALVCEWKETGRPVLITTIDDACASVMLYNMSEGLWKPLMGEKYRAELHLVLAEASSPPGANDDEHYAE